MCSGPFTLHKAEAEPDCPTTTPLNWPLSQICIERHSGKRLGKARFMVHVNVSADEGCYG